VSGRKSSLPGGGPSWRALIQAWKSGAQCCPTSTGAADAETSLHGLAEYANWQSITLNKDPDAV
jgi:hypothetical protein